MADKFILFDNVKSSDLGVNIVRADTGLTSTPFFGGCDIKEEFMKNKITPYHFGTEGKPIEFNVQISPFYTGKWTPELKYVIGKWIACNDYRPFQFSDDLDKCFYAICRSADLMSLFDYGYIDLSFRTNSPYAWSMPSVFSFDLSLNTTSQVIEIDNKSNVDRLYRPTIEIELVGDSTGVRLRNLSNGNKEMSFFGLNPNEVISIDCESEEVVSSNVLNSNPFAKFNVGEKKYWLDLVYGVNRIEITGKCKIWVKTQFPILQ